jgi:hypothetical protein
MYHDDWGIAVLDYGIEQTGFQGRNYSIADVFSFLSKIYENWSGRVVSIFIHIYLQKFGLWYVRLYQVATILTSVVLVFMIIRKNLNTYNKVTCACLPIMLYLAFPASVYIDGIYWYSAASGYLWGLPFFLAGTYHMHVNHKISFISTLLLAFSLTFHEQMAFAVNAYYITYISATWRDLDRRCKIKAIISQIVMAIVTAITVFAPGNFNRKKSSSYLSDDTFSIATQNVKVILDKIANPSSIFFFLLLLSVLSYIIYIRIILDKKQFKFCVCAILAIAVTFGMAYLAISSKVYQVILLVVYTFCIFYLLVHRKMPYIVASIYFASLSSLIPLLMAPGIPWRSCLPFMFLSIIPIIYSFMLVSKNFPALATFSVFLILACLSTSNSYKLFKGYQQNYEVNKLNDFQLQLASFKTRNNYEDIERVQLYRLPSPRFAETMPYDRPLIEKWIKKYYVLPENVVLDWR